MGRPSDWQAPPPAPNEVHYMRRHKNHIGHGSLLLGLSLALVCQVGCGSDDSPPAEAGDETHGDGDGDPGDGDPGDGDPGDGDPGDGDPGDGDPGDGDPGDGDPGDGDPGDGDPGDGDPDPECTVDDECSALDSECSVGVCAEGLCESQAFNEGNACVSDNLCLMDTTCSAGECGGGLELDCGDLDDQCNIGVCNPDLGTCESESANEGLACDDGDSCTYSDVCSAGLCAGTSDPVFSDDFSTDQGWTAEGKWEIGVAMISQTGSISGLTDPEDDHSPSDDGMLAGVLIGGLSSSPGHPPEYLISPVIDLSVLDPEVTVEFRYWRVLVTNVAFMTDTIDVWDGDEWVNVYTALADILQDEWTEIVIDVSAYRNADFQIRFGHEYDGNIPVGPAEPSWSVDDVMITPVCL
jgi:hypothetical protein